jgi:hypothetical protein
MLHRPWLIPPILAFWAVTMGWLVTAKILPSLAAGTAPGYQAFFASGTRLVPVAWTVLCNDSPMGWAISRAERLADRGLLVESLLHFDTLPIDEMLPPWLRTMARHAVEVRPAPAFDARGTLVIDPRGELRSFGSVVMVPGLKEKIVLNGTLEDGKVSIVITGNGMRYATERHFPSTVVLGDELSPQAMMPGLKAGRRWTVPVYSPLRPGSTPIEILHAHVAKEDAMYWEDQLVRVHVVHYRDDPSAHHEPRTTLWVDLSGRVLKQESVVLGSRLAFLRRGDDEAERLAATIDTNAREGRPAVATESGP